MSRKIGFFTVLAVMLLLLAGCNIKKKIGESITEKIIEKAAGDKNVDVDIDGDKITYKSDEGTVTIDENGAKVKAKDSAKDKDKNEDNSKDDKKSGLGIFNKSDKNDDETSDENKDAEEAADNTDSDSENTDLTVDSDNDTLNISSDSGNMVMSSENKWPEGMSADKIPKFDKGVITYSINSPNGASLTIEKVTTDEAKDYIKEVKDAGFTDEAYEASATTGLTYLAKKDNESITVIYSSSDKRLTLGIDIPAEE